MLLAEAERAAREAVAVDSQDGNGYRELARAALFRGRLDESLILFEAAELNAPHYADMLADFADTLAHNSMGDRAKEKMDLALRLNPIPPDDYLWIAGGIDFMRHDFDRALGWLRGMKSPEQAARLMAACAAMLGRHEEAKRYRDDALAIDPTFQVRTWTAQLPIKGKEHLDLYAGALIAAGFP